MMRHKKNYWMYAAIWLLLSQSVTPPAQAYIGPGAALGLVGYAITLGAMILVSLCTVAAWPIMALMKKRKIKANKALETNPSETIVPPVEKS